MKVVFLHLFFAVLVIVDPGFCRATEPREGLAGMSTKEIERRLGPPDERRAGNNGRESWLYGKSVVLFRDGRVTAWSNAGEMSGRENLATVRVGSSSRSSRYRWENPWTPQEGPTEDKVLEELFRRLENDSSKEDHPDTTEAGTANTKEGNGISSSSVVEKIVQDERQAIVE